MRLLRFAFALCLAVSASAQDARTLRDRAQEYLAGLLKLDSSNPPGNETRVAAYLKAIADANGIECELLGGDPARLNFVARLRGSGRSRPLLLVAHSDVVPAERAQWTVDPFGAEIRDGFMYGRGAEDTKDLLAAEMAVLVELKNSGVALSRDVILLAEADEESGSTGIRWLLENAWTKIDAEFALNESGTIIDAPSGARIFRIQTSEKIPTRVTLVARGSAGHGAFPRPDNAVVRLAGATARLAAAVQPVQVDATTRAYFGGLSRLPDYAWLVPLLPRLNVPATALQAAALIRSHEPDLDSLLRTTAVPTMLSAGQKINVIPTTAEAQVDVRRLPGESRDEVLARIRRIVNDRAVEVTPVAGDEMPAAPASPLTTQMYAAMQLVLGQSHPKALVIPYMSRGASDSSLLRAKGVPSYGVPVFLQETSGDRAHGNDERRSVENLRTGTELLLKIVLAVAEQRQDPPASVPLR
jgi:acetylornithine deacetylase/succinyl-diaminopimelate desuccinylase-like protein